MTKKEYEKIKESLINKFGYSEFKISWDALAEFLNLSVPTTKRLIGKLEWEGFLIIERSQNCGGYTSPNVIRIVMEEAEEETFETLKIKLEENYKYIAILEMKLAKAETYKNEFEKTNNKLRILQEKHDKLFNDYIALKTK